MIMQIDKSVSDKLEKFIVDTKLSRTATVEKALEEYINKYNNTGKIKKKTATFPLIGM